jgi:hypothetical protein
MSADMADCYCKGIGGIGFDLAVDAEKPLDHSGNLLFGRSAVSGDGLFYPQCAILVNRKSAAHSGQDYGAACLPEAQCALHVLCEKNLFDRHELRAVFPNRSIDLLENDFQPHAKGAVGRQLYGSVVDMLEPEAIPLHDSVSGIARTWIYPDSSDHFLFQRFQNLVRNIEISINILDVV